MFRNVFQSSTLFSDAFQTLLVRVLGIGLMFGMTAVTARLLGADEYGTFAAAWALAMLLATLVPLGSDRILVRNLSTVDTPEQGGRDTAITHACSALMTCVILVGAAALALFGDVLRIDASWSRTALLAVIMFVPLALTYLRQWVAIPLVGTRSAVMPEQVWLPIGFLVLLIAIRMLHIPLAADAAAIALALTASIVCLLSFQNSRLRSVYAEAWDTRVGFRQVRERIREGIPFVSVSVGSLVLQRCMPILIAAACSFEDAALFAIALQFAGIPEIPQGVISLSLIAPLARHFRDGDLLRADHTIRRVTLIAFLVSLVLSGVVLVAAPLLIILVGSEFSAVTTILPTLLVAAILHSMAAPAILVMQTMKLESIYSKIVLAFVPIQAAGVWIAGHQFGLQGACIAYVVARALFTITLVHVVWHRRRILCLPIPHFPRQWSQRSELLLDTTEITSQA